MDRLAFMTILVGGVLTAVRASVAQPAGKVWRIGLVGSSAIPEDHMGALRAGLAESGFTVGQNVLVEYRWLGDRLSPLPEVVADFVRSAVDVIVAYGSPATLSAKTATQSIPIVMVGARDPVEQGIVASLARPGGNITGISAATGPSIASKRLTLIKEAVPRASRIGHLWSSAFPGTKPHTDAMLRAGGPLKMRVTSFDVKGRDDLSSAFATMQRGGDQVRVAGESQDGEEPGHHNTGILLDPSRPRHRMSERPATAPQVASNFTLHRNAPSRCSVAAGERAR